MLRNRPSANGCASMRFSIRCRARPTAVGFPTVFVRLTGCPLRCQYCDTEYAFHAGDWHDIDGIVEKVRELRAPHVCVTGGEPLAQPNCLTSCSSGCAMPDIEVSLETSGALDIAAVDARVARVVDVKTPGSGEACAQSGREFRAPHAARPAEIRDLLARGLRLEQGVHRRSMRLAERCQVLFSPSYHAGVAPRSWRIGFWRIACRCAFNCSFTRSCGATCPGNDSRVRAIVLLSGGLDSATVLAIARAQRISHATR